MAIGGRVYPLLERKGAISDTDRTPDRKGVMQKNLL